ncbi:MAG: hypothetical protein AABZ53_05880 [Planctomycetota bacterium]
MSLVPLQPPPAPPPTPSHDDLLVAWSKFLADPIAITAHFNITPTQLLDALAEPAFVERKAHWDALQLAHLHALALDHQTAAAAKLRELTASADPIEARKAATTLTRWWPGPPQTSRSSRARSSTTPGQLTTPHGPDRNPDPKALLTSLMSRFRNTSERNRTNTIAQVASQFAPNITLDHVPLRPGVLADPLLLANRVVQSSLAELCQPGDVTVKQSTTTPTTSILQVICLHEEADALVVNFELSRADTVSPWLVAAVTAGHRPPPMPRGTSP